MKLEIAFNYILCYAYVLNHINQVVKENQRLTMLLFVKLSRFVVDFDENKNNNLKIELYMNDSCYIYLPIE